MATIRIGNKYVIDLPVKDANRDLVTDLATADAVLFQIKEEASDADVDALVSLSVGSGIAVDTPSTGYIRITIDSDDTTGNTAGVKYWACEVQYPGGNNQEIFIKENKIIINQVTFEEDVIRG